MALIDYVLEDNARVRNARDKDEPYFIKSIMAAYPGCKAWQGTTQDDFKHIDVFVKFSDGIKWNVDVKSEGQHSKNFSLCIKNSKGKYLRLMTAYGMYLAFIDYDENIIYIIHKPDLHEMTKRLNYKRRISNDGRTEYILIHKTDLENNSKVIQIPLIK